MTMELNTNLSSLNVRYNLFRNYGPMNESMERLSTGLRVNSAKDDVAGLAISHRISTRARSLNQALRNINDTVSITQSAEKALQETSNILQRMRELSLQAANDTNSGTDRENLQNEVNTLIQEINRIAESSHFNGRKLLDGTFISQSFQYGADNNQAAKFSINDAHANKMGNYTLSITSDGTISHANQSTDNALINGSASITGDGGTISLDTSAAMTAKEIAEAVNLENQDSGVVAEAVTYAKISITDNIIGFMELELYGENTIEVTVISGAILGGDLTPFKDAINAKYNDTKISATINSNKSEMILYNEEGYNIRMDIFPSLGSFNITGLKADGLSESGAAIIVPNPLFGSLDITIGGNVTFKSDDVLTISGDGGGIFATENPSISSFDFNPVSEIDVSDQPALIKNPTNVIDGAIEYISELRADLASIQNRFGSTMANLQNVSNNLTESSSRILDADFINESAQIAKSQILIQMGNAMLTQSKWLPQQVLSMLESNFNDSIF